MLRAKLEKHDDGLFLVIPDEHAGSLGLKVGDELEYVWREGRLVLVHATERSWAMEQKGESP